MPATHKFTLLDEWGKPHTYETTAFRPSQGGKLRTRVASLLVQPIAAAFYEISKGGDLAGLRDLAVITTGAVTDANNIPIPAGDPRLAQLQALATDKIKGWMSEIDPSRIASAARDALRDMPEELPFQLLEHTLRDGDAMFAQQNFDAAYERNYSELDAAIWEVVQFNGFLSLAGILRQRPTKP